MGKRPQKPNSPKASIRAAVEARKKANLREKAVVDLGAYRELMEAEAPSILVVDDDESVRLSLKRLLEGEGYQVAVASDGMELAKSLERSDFDLMFIDQRLPWVEGLELLSIIRAHQAYQKLPIVLMSGLNDPKLIKSAILQGANHYLPKPFDYADLKGVLEMLLKPPSTQNKYP